MRKIWVLVFVLLGLLLSNDIFLSKEVRLSFKQIASKDIDYEIVYARSKSSPLEYSVRKTVSKDQVVVDFILPTGKLEQFGIKINNNFQDVIISDLKINRKNFDLARLVDKSGSPLSLKNEEFTVSNKTQDMLLLTKENLNIKNSISINYKLFFLCLFSYVIIVVFALKFLNSMTNKIDAIFVILFWIVLFIPMMKISNQDKTDVENRMLAKYENLFVNGCLNE